MMSSLLMQGVLLGPMKYQCRIQRCLGIGAEKYPQKRFWNFFSMLVLRKNEMK